VNTGVKVNWAAGQVKEKAVHIDADGVNKAWVQGVMRHNEGLIGQAVEVKLASSLEPAIKVIVSWPVGPRLGNPILSCCI
jgi:hypothetical protein